MATVLVLVLAVLVGPVLGAGLAWLLRRRRAWHLFLAALAGQAVAYLALVVVSQIRYHQAVSAVRPEEGLVLVQRPIGAPSVFGAGFLIAAALVVGAVAAAVARARTRKVAEAA